MITVSICCDCKHYKGLKDGWIMLCDAFPEGIPPKGNYDPKVNNNINYEKKDEE